MTEAEYEDRNRQPEENETEVLRAKVQAWQALAAQAAHRIGNQTFSIRGTLRSLSSAELSADAREEVKCIEGCLARIEGILDEFKRFVTRIEPRRKACDACELMREAARHVSDALRSINLECKFPTEELTVNVDAHLMEEAIEELLINAARALEGKGTIRLAAERASALPAQLLPPGEEAAYVVLSVEDNGPGIKREDSGRIFEPFFSTTAGGTGLGLSLVQKTVEAHGGVIRETGTYGEGARFEILLPLKGGDCDVQGSDRG